MKTWYDKDGNKYIEVDGVVYVAVEVMLKEIEKVMEIFNK